MAWADIVTHGAIGLVGLVLFIYSIHIYTRGERDSRVYMLPSSDVESELEDTSSQNDKTARQ